MLKFFRRIRKRLLDSGKIRNYTFYALGEIALVVIGILIALQINNWNEQRKANLEFDLLVSATENELLSTIEQATNSINSGYEQDELIHIFQLDTITLEGLKNGYSRIPSIGNEPIYFDSENIRLLLENSKDFPQKYTSLLPLLRQYQLFADNQRKYMDLAIDHANDFRVQLANSYPWFGSTSRNSEEALNFYLNDFLYRNHVKIHRQRNGNNMTLISGIQSTALGLLLVINQIRNGANNQELIALSQKLGLTPFQEVDCKDDLVSSNKESGVVSYYLLVNSLNRPVSIYLINENGERFDKSTLRAKESITTYPAWFTPNMHFEVVNADDECIKKYQTSRNGFLFIR